MVQQRASAILGPYLWSDPPQHFVVIFKSGTHPHGCCFKPRQQKFNEMNGARLASPIRGELGYAHWPQLGTQFIALLGTKFGAHEGNKMFALTCSAIRATLG